MLPRIDGLTILQKLKALRSKTPNISSSERDTSDHKIEDLDSGAVDYLVKPIELRELLARVRAQLRKRYAPVGDSATVSDLTINFGFKRIRVLQINSD